MAASYFSVILREHGATDGKRSALLDQTGLTEDLLGPGAEITLGQQLQQLRNGVRLLEPSWALATGARLHAAAHGPVGFAAVSAPCLQKTLEIMARFSHLRAPHFRMRAQMEGREVRLIAEDRVALTEVERRALLDMVMLSTQAMIESVLGRPMYEARVEMPGDAPEHLTSYRDAFHAPVHFGCRDAAIVIPLTWLSVASPFADARMCDGMLGRLHARASRLDGDMMLAARVERLLAERGLKLGMRTVARLLGMSGRTLARRLASQDTSYQALLNEATKSRAVVLLRDPDLTVAEVAFALGYEDAANFGRAFRRWFQCSPGAYRRSVDLDADGETH